MDRHPDCLPPAHVFAVYETYREAAQTLEHLERYGVPRRELYVRPHHLEFVSRDGGPLLFRLLPTVVGALLGALVGAGVGPAMGVSAPLGHLQPGAAIGMLAGGPTLLCGWWAARWLGQPWKREAGYVVTNRFEVLVSPSHTTEALRLLAVMPPPAGNPPWLQGEAGA